LPSGELPTFRVPVGPGLGIEMGKGVGPIRFGATVETIERLLGEPCEERVTKAQGRLACRYSAHAIEFFLEQGVLERIHVHGRGRTFRAEPHLEYGIFNGAFVEGAALGMLKEGVQDFLGPPPRVETLDPRDADHVAERHHYPRGTVLEYDRSASGNLVLVGVILSR
jgi:hypothetical protein